MDGSIDQNIIGGTPPYTYQSYGWYVWNNGDTTEDISNLIACYVILMVYSVTTGGHGYKWMFHYSNNFC